MRILIMKKIILVTLSIATIMMACPAFASQETLRQELISAGVPAGNPTYLADYWANVIYNNINNKQTDWQNAEFLTVLNPFDVTLTAYGRLAIYDMIITLKSQLRAINSNLDSISEYLYTDSAKRDRWVASGYLAVTNYTGANPGNGKPIQISVTGIGVTAIANMYALKLSLEGVGIPMGVSDAYADLIFTDSAFRQNWINANFISVSMTGSVITNVSLTGYGQVAAGKMYHLIQSLQSSGLGLWVAEKVAPSLYGNSTMRALLASKGMVKIATSSQGMSIWGISSCTDPSDGTTYRNYYAPLGMSHSAWVLNEAGVIAPYASFMALDVAPHAAMQNINNIIANFAAVKSTYGFLDAVDTDNGDVAQLYSTLPQGIILVSIANAVQDGVIQDYFMGSDPIVISRSQLNENFSTVVTDPTLAQLDTSALSDSEKSALRAIAVDTWSYFSSMTNAGTHWLPPDYHRVGTDAIDFTTPTDIALYLMGIVSAEKLGIIDSASAQQKVTDTLATLATLDKWNGLYHNYYKVNTLLAVTPTEKFISTVDNGWLASALLVVRQAYTGSIRTNADVLFNAMQFGKLYDSVSGLLANGLNPIDSTTGTRTSACYGNIYTEIRPTVLLAIGKGDIPASVWDNMVTAFPSDWTWQAQASQNGAYTYMVNGTPFHYIPTWDGTMFEALMPNLVIDNKTFSSSGFAIQDKAYVFLQKLYATGAIDAGYTKGSDSITLTTYGQAAFGIINNLINSFKGMSGVNDNTAVQAAMSIFTDDAMRTDWINKGYITVVSSGSQITEVTITGAGNLQLPNILSGGDGTAMALQVHQAIGDNNLQNAFQLMYGVPVANQSLDIEAYKNLLIGIGAYIIQNSFYTMPGYYTVSDFVSELTKTAQLHGALVAQNLQSVFEVVTGIPVSHQDPVAYPNEYRAYLAGVVNGLTYNFTNYVASLAGPSNVDSAINNPTSLRTQFAIMYRVPISEQLMSNPTYYSLIQGIAGYMSEHPDFTIDKFRSELSNSADLHAALDANNLRDAFALASGISVADQLAVTANYRGYLAGVVNNGSNYSLDRYIILLRTTDKAIKIDRALGADLSGVLRADFAIIYGIASVDQTLSNSNYLSLLRGAADYMIHVNPELTISVFTAQIKNTVDLDAAIGANGLRLAFDTMYGADTQTFNNKFYMDSLSGISSYMYSHPEYTVLSFINELAKITELHNAIVAQNLQSAFECASGIPIGIQVPYRPPLFEYRSALAGIVNGTSYNLTNYVASLAGPSNVDSAINNPTSLRAQFATMYQVPVSEQLMSNPTYYSLIQGIAGYMSEHSEFTIDKFRSELSNSADLHAALDANNVRACFAAISGISIADQLAVTAQYRRYLAGTVNWPGYTLNGYLTNTLGVSPSDLYADFGSQGFWKYSNNKWTQISTANADRFMLSEPNNGSNDVISDFGSSGLWKYSNNAWISLSTANADTFKVSGIINNSYDIVSDFGADGLYKYSSSTWTQLSTADSEGFMLSAIYNNSYDIISSFGSSGLWKYSNTSWAQLSTANADSFMLSQLNNGSYDVISDFGSSGLWKYSSTTWTQLSTANADSFMLSQLNNGSYDVIANFGSYGLYKYSNTNWTQLSTANADSFMLSQLNNGSYDVIANFGSSGLWKYSNTSWTQLSTANAESFKLSSITNNTYDIIADFGDSGLWKHSNNTWTQLSTANVDPELLQKLDVQNGIQAYGKTAEGGFTFTSALAGGPTKPDVNKA